MEDRDFPNLLGIWQQSHLTVPDIRGMNLGDSLHLRNLVRYFTP